MQAWEERKAVYQRREIVALNPSLESPSVLLLLLLLKKIIITVWL